MRRRTKWILVGVGVGATLLVLSVIASFVLGIGEPVMTARASLVAHAVPGGVEITHQNGDALDLNKLYIYVTSGGGGVLAQITEGGYFAKGDTMVINLRTNPPTVLLKGIPLSTSVQGTLINPTSGNVVQIRMNYPAWTSRGQEVGQQQVMSVQVTLL